MTEKHPPHIYLVPGLGADGRLFNRLVWDDIIERTTIQWLAPEKDEKIEDYAYRLSRQVDTKWPFILVGVSLGGILAIEMAKHINPDKIIIISSIKHKNERPFYFEPGKYIRLSIWPHTKRKFLFKMLVRIFFGAVKNKELEIFRDMLGKTDRNFIKWAQYAVVTWQNTQVFDNLTHIHGTKDLVFPVVFIKDYIPVPNGTHFMIANRARQISKIINEVVSR